jgi:hypothetical protein
VCFHIISDNIIFIDRFDLKTINNTKEMAKEIEEERESAQLTQKLIEDEKQEVVIVKRVLLGFQDTNERKISFSL